MKRSRNDVPRLPGGQLMLEADAANYLKLSVAFLRHDRLKRRLIPFVRLGRAIRYRQHDLDAAVERLVEGKK